MASFSWLKLNPTNTDISELPSARDGCAAAIVDKNLFIFGGFVDVKNVKPDEPPMTTTNDLYRYDMLEAKWFKVESKGNIPTKRSGAGSWSFNDTVYIFGGFDLDAGWNCDLFQFTFDKQTNTATWDRVEAKGPTPLARDKMSIVSKANGVAYVFGGFGPMVGEDEDGWGDGQTFHWLGDLHTFDSASKEWKKLPSIDAPKLCAVGGLVCELENSLFYFGGSGSSNPSQRSDALYKADLSTEPVKFTKVTPPGTPPSARSFVNAVKLNNNMIVFGGRGRSQENYNDLYVYNGEEWRKIDAKGEQQPSARAFASFVERDEQTALLFGGSTADERFNDVWLLTRKSEE